MDLPLISKLTRLSQVTVHPRVREVPHNHEDTE